MPLVEVHERLPAAVEDVWALVTDVEAYPRLMEPVRSLEVLERGPSHKVTAWEVVLKGSILAWTEYEEHHPARYRLDYHQVEGDLDEFDGYWQLDRVDDRTTDAVLLVRFEIGIPMLREMLDPVAERAIRENSRKMLRSLAPSALGGSS